MRTVLALVALSATLLVTSCGDEDPTPADRVAFERSVVSAADALAAGGTVPADLVADLCEGAEAFPDVLVVPAVSTVIAEECA